MKLKMVVLGVVLSMLVSGFAMGADNEYFPPFIGSYSNLATYVYTNGAQPRILMFVKLLSQAAVTASVYVVNSGGWTNAALPVTNNGTSISWAATGTDGWLLWRNEKLNLAKGATGTNKNTRFILIFRNPEE